MTDTIRWGVISTANIGRKRVIPAIQQSRNGTVAAVASRSLESAQAFADELDIPTAYGSYEDLLADPDIDAIYNPLPNHLHAGWSIKAAEAGKPTLCEKPLAVHADEAQGIVDAFKERGIPFAEAFMYRFHPRTERVKQLVDEGALGEVRLIRAAFSFQIGSEDNVRLYGPEQGGGSLMDVGCYCINLMRHVTSEEPERVTAAAVFGEKSGVDEWLVGTLAFPSGALGVLDCGFRSPQRHTYEIRGSEGTLIADEAFGTPPDASTSIQLWQGETYQEVSFGPANHYVLMAEDFADAILESRPPRFDAQDAVENMRVIDRMLADARSAQPGGQS